MPDDRAPEFNGWKPPLVYDVGTDENRIATQADLDRFRLVQTAYGQLRSLFRQAEAIHEQLKAACEEVKS